VLFFKNGAVKSMEGGGNSGLIEQTDNDGHPKEKKRKGGCLSGPIRSGLSSHGSAMSYFLARNFSWMRYGGAKKRKGVE